MLFRSQTLSDIEDDLEEVTRRPSPPKKKRKKVSGGKDIATKRLKSLKKT